MLLLAYFFRVRFKIVFFGDDFLLLQMITSTQQNMKFNRILFLSTFFCCRVFAQTPEQLISKNDVERIIKTLSADDMQGRATFTPGIEKAARFIESEYKTIGLQPLAGNKDYRQNFSMTKSTPVSVSASINNNIIPKENVTVVSGTPTFTWSNNAEVEVVKIKAED
ncbi:MAG: hypothetical protein ACRYFB_10350, partial [Janthinobacterium lividum]